MKKFIEVFNTKTGDVVKRVEVTGKSDTEVIKSECDLLRNMHIDFDTRIVEDDEA